jgi:hypothetical protein
MTGKAWGQKARLFIEKIMTEKLSFQLMSKRLKNCKNSDFY